MSNSYENVIEGLRRKVGEAIGSIRSLRTERETQEENRDYVYSVLFGNADPGIISFFGYAYSLANDLIGRSSTSPNQTSDNGGESAWKSKLESAVTTTGDDDIYPTDNTTGIAEDEINENSDWFGDNGDDGVDSGGIIPKLEDVLEVIGEEASDNSDGRGPFEDESAAESHRDSTRGSGLLGKRTENSVIYSEGIDPVEWYVGQDGIDTPDFYEDDIETALSELISEISSIRSTISNQLSEIQKVLDEENDVFVEAEIDVEPDFISWVSDLESLDATLESIEDDAQEALDYFNQFDPDDDISEQSGYDQSEFDENLIDLQLDISDWETNIQNGTESTLDHLNNLRDYRLFWVKQLIKKPESPMISLYGLQSAFSQAQSKLDREKQDLFEVGDDPDSWLPIASVVASYWNPKLDDDTGEVLEHRSNLQWLGSAAHNTYEIYRKEIEEVSDPEEEWVLGDPHEVRTEFSEDSGMIPPLFLDTDVEEGKIYAYRIRGREISGAEQPRIPGQNLGAAISSLFSEVFEVISVETINEEKRVEVNVEEPEIAAGLFVWTSTSGFVKMKRIKNGKLAFEESAEFEVGENLYVCPSVVKVG